MVEFNDYDLKYPDLIIEILEYFTIETGDVNSKTVLSFCLDNKDMMTIQPQILVKICEILCLNNILEVRHRGGVGGTNNSYFCRSINYELLNANRQKFTHKYNSIVYGFEYIYRYYQDIVIPIIAYKEGDDPMEGAMGTAFKFHNGLVTARHCVMSEPKKLQESEEDYKEKAIKTVAIKGYSASQLKSALVFVSTNPYIDVAYIQTNENAHVFEDVPKTLDDILVMGFPNIPRFLDFCTAEKATISSIADSRMTPTRGSVAAMADEMGTYKKLMLITAKIKGGNSGGPVINKYGSVTGVAFGSAIGEGDMYDDLGYGIATPISIINSIGKENNQIEVSFVDFPE